MADVPHAPPPRAPSPLLPFAGARPPAPAWAQAALATAPGWIVVATGVVVVTGFSTWSE